MNYVDVLKKNLITSIDAKKDLLQRSDQLEVFDSVLKCLVRHYNQGGRLYIAGNGGSAADAQHLAAEFVSKLAKDRDPLPAEALTVDSSILTAIGNDYGFDHIFSRQIAAKMTDKDVFLGITTSGNSKNILRAIEQCKMMNIPTILLSGHAGGVAQSLVDFCLLVPGQTTATIQELHIVLAHSLCECIEMEIFG